MSKEDVTDEAIRFAKANQNFFDEIEERKEVATKKPKNK